MQITPVSNQNFNGRVIGCSWLKPKQKKVFKQVYPCLQKMVKGKDFDLKIYKSYGGEIRICTTKQPEYSVVDSNNPAIWIDRAKEVIEGL